MHDDHALGKDAAALPAPSPDQPLIAPLDRTAARRKWTVPREPRHWPSWDGAAWRWTNKARADLPDLRAILPGRAHNGDDAQLALALCAALTRQYGSAALPPVGDLGELWTCGDDLVWSPAALDSVRSLLTNWTGRAIVGERPDKRDPDAQPLPVTARVSAGKVDGVYSLARASCGQWRQGAGWFEQRPPSIVFDGVAVSVAPNLSGLVREGLTPDHGARWGFGWQLPSLTSTPDAPLWTGYLSGMFGGAAESFADTDARIAYLETWAGLALLGLAPRLQLPALILCGERGTGKSTLAALLTALYPAGAVASVEPQQWGSTDAAGYHLAELAGKLLNVVYDLDLTAPITEAATLKKVIFGEPLTARPIRRDPVRFTPRAAHLWCGNGLPKVTGADAALWDRMLPLVVSGPPWRGAPGERRDLGEMLRGELPQIVARLLWRAAQALERVATREPLLPAPPSSVARLAMWRNTADSVALWRSERLNYDAALPASRSITRPAAWQDYQAWCQDTRHQPCAQHEWARRLEAQGVVIKRARAGAWVLVGYELGS